MIAVSGAASIALRLGLERTLAIASVRTIAQLTLIGLVLEWVFSADRWYIVLLLAAVMTITAGVAAANRVERRYGGLVWDAIVAVWASSWLTTAYVLLVVLQKGAKWYEPQYLAPLLGMVLGNSLTGISLGVGSLTDSFHARRGEVETLLTLGATRWEAARAAVQHAVRTGMIPIINAMMVVGIVSLPGMMTGQILSGTAPIDAVKYQIVVMFMITSATAMGTVGSVLLSYRRLLNANHQFVANPLVPGN